MNQGIPLSVEVMELVVVIPRRWRDNGVRSRNGKKEEYHSDKEPWRFVRHVHMIRTKDVFRSKQEEKHSYEFTTGELNNEAHAEKRWRDLLTFGMWSRCACGIEPHTNPGQGNPVPINQYRTMVAWS
jgi:hypothetical protein